MSEFVSMYEVLPHDRAALPPIEQLYVKTKSRDPALCGCRLCRKAIRVTLPDFELAPLEIDGPWLVSVSDWGTLKAYKVPGGFELR